MQYEIFPGDAPYDLFQAFSGPMKECRVRFLTEMANECANHLDSKISETGLNEILERCLMDYNGDAAVSLSVRISNEKRDLKEYGLLNGPIFAFDDEEETDVIKYMLSGRAYKFLDFLKAAQSDDLAETREYDITSARTEFSHVKMDPGGNDAYDLLISAHKTMEKLIKHLSVFESEFRDFLEKDEGKASNAREAGEWMTKILDSKYVNEYHTVSNNTLGYSYKIEQIGSMAKEMLRKTDRGKQDVRAMAEARYRQMMVVSNGEVKTTVDELESEIRRLLRRIQTIADTEYVYRLGSIQKLVAGVIQRLANLIMAYGGDMDSSTIITKICSILLYSDKTETPIPGLTGIYSAKVLDTGSLKEKPVKREGREELVDHENTPDGTTPKIQGSLEERLRKYTDENFQDGQAIRLPDLPYRSVDDYRCAISLLAKATSDSPGREWEIVSELGAYDRQEDTGEYLIPDITIRKRLPEERGSKSRAWTNDEATESDEKPEGDDYGLAG